MDPTIRYASTSDGVTIAYTALGDGPALVSMPSGLLSNVVALHRIPSIARAYERLAEHMRVVLYDGRGTGSSQRDVDDVSPEAMLRDLEAVVRHAGLETFALLGYYFTVGTAIAYAERNPERVTKLVLFGGSVRGDRMFGTSFSQALVTLVDHDWDAAIESAAHAWMGWTGSEDERLAVDTYRQSATPAMAHALFEAARGMDVSETATKVRAAALVIHRHEERQMPLEVAQELAAALPDARLLHLEGTSGLLFLQDPDGDADLLLDFLTGRPHDAIEPAPRSKGRPRGGEPAPGVFISCSERQKEALGLPFKSLLAGKGLRGYVVSDEPRPDGAWTPEEKVDAYLARSDAVVVFATGDLAAGEDRYTRPNIGDEIGRARAEPHLRDRVVVLKEHGVTLPSNINPAYESLDPAHPERAFERALVQLREWGIGAG
ncbi:MAG TPA: alpha/beta hydrolase [Candidatus Limnocylindrales bacterium]|nr:alpha/beta hydrolase [Candidatus Limnocylindrales bacterium]